MNPARPPAPAPALSDAEVLRQVGIALECYVSTLHMQGTTIKNPGIAQAKMQESETVQALRDRLRLLAQQPAAPAPALALVEELREAEAELMDMRSGQMSVGPAWRVEVALNMVKEGLRRTLKEHDTLAHRRASLAKARAVLAAEAGEVRP